MGTVTDTIDNADRTTRTITDEAGRTIRTIQNFDGQEYGATYPVVSGFDSDGHVQAGDTDYDITVDYQYDSAGRLVTMTAYDANGTTVQPEATKYIYGCAYNGSLQTAVVYPDDTVDVPVQDSTTKDWSIAEDNGDHTETTYDRLGRTATTTDQRGVVHEYGYDSAGRLCMDFVSNLGRTGEHVDGVVRGIATSYDDLGRVQSVESWSYDDNNGWTAPPINEVSYSYDGWGNLAKSGRPMTALLTPTPRPPYNTPTTMGPSTAWRSFCG